MSNYTCPDCRQVVDWRGVDAAAAKTDHACGKVVLDTDAPKSRGRKDDPKHDAWQRRVIEIAIQHGFSREHIYHTRDSRGSQKGYPDLHMLNLGTIRSVFVECKVGKDKQKREQLSWMHGLRRCGHEAYCWYPSDEPEAIRILAGVHESHRPHG